MQRFLYFIVICFLTVSGIPKTNTGTPIEAVNAANNNDLYDSFLNVSYGDAQGNDNLLDAYLPKQRDRNTKVIVYIHGGSWKHSDKKEFPQTMIDELVGKRKYAFASINYRLVKEDGANAFPAQIEDVKKALAFISSYAGEYNYDGSSFALIGASAGAHLALLYAYGHDEKKQVKTVVDIYGPTDLTDPAVRKPGSENNAIIEEFLSTKKNDKDFAKQASPYFHLTAASAVPTIIFHGTADELVPLSQSEKLNTKLKELKTTVQLELYPGKKHEFTPDMAVDIFAKMIAWLEKYYPVNG